MYFFQRVITRAGGRIDNQLAEIVRGASITFLIKVLGAGLSFGFNVVLARMLGAEGSGLYFLAVTVTTIGMTVGRFGLDNTLLRYVAASAAKNDWIAVRGVYVKSMVLATIASTAISLIIVTLAPWFAITVFNKPELANLLSLMAIAVPALALNLLHGEALKAIKRVRDSQFVSGMVVPGLSLIGFFLVGRSWGLIGAVYSYVSAALFSAVLGWWYWHRATPQLKNITGSFSNTNLFNSCLPLLVVATSGMLSSWTATFYLGIWGSSSEVGIYGAANRTAMLTSFVLLSVNSIVAPKFASLYSRGDLEGLARIARQSTMMMIFIAGPILLFFMIFPGVVMSMFGAQFRQGGILLSILSIGQFVNVISGSVGYLLLMTGHERLVQNVSIMIGLLSLILGLVLIPTLGVLGAALSTAICTASLNLILVYVVRSRLGFMTIPFWPTTTSKADAQL